MAGEFKVLWQDSNESDYALNAINMNYMLPSFNFARGQFISTDVSDGNRQKLKIDNDGFIKMISNGIHYCYKNNQPFSFEPASLLDTGSTLSNAKNYYVYLVFNGLVADLVVSLNSTFPEGATADNSRKIGGFHTLCADVGTIDGHALTGYKADDILPLSVWDLVHRPQSSPEAMVYDALLKNWIDIYLQSGTLNTTANVFDGTVTVSRMQCQHTEDMFLKGKRLLSSEEFASAMEGSNQQTNIQGSAAPDKTGGHVDTAGRRMISNIGVEDGCGAYWQWLRDLGPAGKEVSTTWNGTSLDGKGQQYGDIYAVIAGGFWDYSSSCGSRTLHGDSSRLGVAAAVAGRGCSPSRCVF